MSGSSAEVPAADTAAIAKQPATTNQLATESIVVYADAAPEHTATAEQPAAEQPAYKQPAAETATAAEKPTSRQATRCQGSATDTTTTAEQPAAEQHASENPTGDSAGATASAPRRLSFRRMFAERSVHISTVVF